MRDLTITLDGESSGGPYKSIMQNDPEVGEIGRKPQLCEMCIECYSIIGIGRSKCSHTNGLGIAHHPKDHIAICVLNRPEFHDIYIAD